MGRTAHASLLPGMELAVAAASPAAPAWPQVVRVGANDWAIVPDGAPPPVTAAVCAAADLHRGAAPALAAADDDVRRHGPPGPHRVAVARLELDRCGAWLTIGCAGFPLPVVVRRAGWVDVRGQAGTALAGDERFDVADDRVGLGPEDGIVFCNDALLSVRDRAGESFAEEALFAALLRRTGVGADRLAAAVLEAAEEHGAAVPESAAVLALRVPPSAESDPDGRLRGALGFAGHLPLPGYAVGEPHWGHRARPAPPREARFALDSHPAAIPSARRFVVNLLHSWRMSELDMDDVELVTSELLGNAVRHAGTPTTVLVTYDGSRVRIAVGDGSRALPQQRPLTDDELGGRGLVIVDALAAAWGTTATVEGKRVWAEIEVPPPQLAS